MLTSISTLPIVETHPKIRQPHPRSNRLNPLRPLHNAIMIAIKIPKNHPRNLFLLLRRHIRITLIVQSVEPAHLVRGPAAGFVKVVKLEERPGVEVADVMFLCSNR